MEIPTEAKLSKKELRAISDEKLLYDAYLELWYAEGYLRNHVADLSDTMKDAKKLLKKANKNLKKSIERYNLIYGKYPPEPRK